MGREKGNANRVSLTEVHAQSGVSRKKNPAPSRWDLQKRIGPHAPGVLVLDLGVGADPCTHTVAA